MNTFLALGGIAVLAALLIVLMLVAARLSDPDRPRKPPHVPATRHRPRDVNARRTRVVLRPNTGRNRR
jgi:hypothetical protein